MASSRPAQTSKRKPDGNEAPREDNATDDDVSSTDIDTTSSGEPDSPAPITSREPPPGKVVPPAPGPSTSAKPESVASQEFGTIKPRISKFREEGEELQNDRRRVLEEKRRLNGTDESIGEMGQDTTQPVGGDGRNSVSPSETEDEDARGRPPTNKMVTSAKARRGNKTNTPPVSDSSASDTEDERTVRNVSKPSLSKAEKPTSASTTKSSSSRRPTDIRGTSQNSTPSSSRTKSQPAKIPSQTTKQTVRSSSRTQQPDRTYQSSTCNGFQCCPGLGGCLHGCWGWSGWRFIRRHLAWPIAVAMVGLMIALGITGPVLGFYFCEVGGTEFGGLGYCDSTGETCTTAVLYSSSTLQLSSYTWLPSATLPGLLLAFATFGALSLLALLYLLFRQVCLQSVCQGCCEYDIEAQRQRRDASGETQRVKQEALNRFHLIMDLTFVAIAILSFLLMLWNGAAQDTPLLGETLWDVLLGFAAAWAVVRMVYGNERVVNKGINNANLTARRVAQRAKNASGRAVKGGRRSQSRRR